jgi:SsrA-binding protein
MKIIKNNKQAYFNYEVLDEFKAGMVLTGPEIKSVRLGNINLKGAYVVIQSNGVFIKGMHISRYKYDSSADFDPFRIRKLLLTEKEIHKIGNSLNTEGVTMVPLAIGLDGKYAKIQIGVVRGKKKYDKRQTIKERDTKRQIERTVKRFR